MNQLPLRARSFACLAAALLAGPTIAHAVIVSGSLAFSATGLPAGAPINPVTGSVSYSFDNSAGFFNQPDGATVNGVVIDVNVLGISLPGTWVPVLTYIQNLDVLAIGHGPTTVVTAGTDDWRFAVTNVSSNPVFREFVYSEATIADATFLTNTGTVAMIPEPATGALLALGLAALRLRRPRSRASN